MNDFIKIINAKLPDGITYGKLNNTDKAIIKGMFKVYDKTIEFVYPVVEGFPTPTLKAQTKVVISAMETFRSEIGDCACEYILSVSEKISEKHISERVDEDDGK